jgi:hypothetical protein
MGSSASCLTGFDAARLGQHQFSQRDIICLLALPICHLGLR